MTAHPNPDAPLQVICEDWTRLPRFTRRANGPVPDWVHAVIRAWAHGLVEIEPAEYRYVRTALEYLPAFDLDGSEWDWQHDGADVWTLVHIAPDGMLFEEDPRYLLDDDDA